MGELQSHLAGRWQRGQGPGEILLNPCTEEPPGAV